MTPSAPRVRRRFDARLLLTLAAALCVAVACATFQGGPQSWWTARGPVVPHDSFPADCSLCHEGSGWTEIRADFRFDHLEQAGVALEGAHAEAECLRCHNDRGPVASFAARGCAGCHEDLHLGQLGQDCEACHAQTDWPPRGQIARHALTRFPLVGAHAVTQCIQCHAGSEAGIFTPTDASCSACHLDDALATTMPSHAAQGWIADCERCHTPIAWSGAAFNHGFFPLTGAHAAAACEACHVGGVFAGLTTNCYSCHADDYLGAQDPNHVTAGIPTSCQDCHGTASWSGARFDHKGITGACADCHLGDYQTARDPDHVALGFPLTCQNCHNTQRWSGAGFNHSGITESCVTCHLSDYNATTDPNHSVLGFPHACETCHNTTSWSGANFSHPWFPINSGPHANRNCSDCHPAPANFAVFSCTDCHAHRRSEMDGKHKDVPGYVWQSSACYACHPDGRE
jgi:hypothetical protein